MIADLAHYRNEMVELCRQFGVRRLEAFGSATGGEYDRAGSEIDLLVELEPPAGVSRFDAFFGLKEGLEALLRRPVDLVDPSALDNPYFAKRSRVRGRNSMRCDSRAYFWNARWVWEVATERAASLVAVLDGLLGEQS